MAIFRQGYVVNTNGEPVSGKDGRIYEVTDSTGESPLDVTDVSEIPMAMVSITGSGVNQAFIVADRTQVRWISEDGMDHVLFESLDGMEAAAQSAVATSESALQRIATFLESVGVPGGVAALNSEGNVIDANQDVIGNDTRRAGAVIWAYGSTTARPTGSSEVMVIWVTEGDAPRNALSGVDVWLNAGVVR